MSRYDDIDPRDIDPATNRPYANYSSPSLDTSFDDGERDIDDEPAAAARSACAEGDRLSADLRCEYCNRPDAECGARPCNLAMLDEEDDEFFSDDPRAMQGMGR